MRGGAGGAQMAAAGLAGLSEFLQEAALLSGDSDTEEDRAQEGVRLVTMHAVKGLEFEAVCIAGVPPPARPPHPTCPRAPSQRRRQLVGRPSPKRYSYRAPASQAVCNHRPCAMQICQRYSAQTMGCGIGGGMSRLMHQALLEVVYNDGPHLNDCGRRRWRRWPS